MKCGEFSAHKEHIYDVLSFTKKALEVGNQVNSALPVPIPGYGPVAQVLIALIDRVEKTRTNGKALEALSEEIKKLVEVIRNTREKVKSQLGQLTQDEEKQNAVTSGLQNSSYLSSKVDKLCEDLNALKTRADDLYTGPFFLRCFHSSRDAGILKELQDGITKAIQFFNLQCQVAIEAVVTDILGGVINLEKKVNEVKVVVERSEDAQAVAMEEKILEALPHADAGFRAAVNHTKSNFIEGTRVEIFAALNDWVHGWTSDLSSKAVCILSGGAGTGKSTIAWEFARQLQDVHNLGASFFFVRGVADLDSTRLFFPTLAYQLAHSQRTLRVPIVNAAREHLEHGRNQQMRYEAPNLLHRPLRDVDGQHHPIFLIVDAVDECTENASSLVPEMLEWLISSIRHAAFPLRIFFTSRPEHLVEDKLFSPNWSADVHTISLHDLSPESVKRDISIFIRDKVARMPSGAALLAAQPDLVEQLALRADGLFVYAQTAMEFVSSYSEYAEERLETLLSDGPSRHSAYLKPLDKLYLTVLEYAFPAEDLQDYRLRERVQTMLGCIALLRNPMSPRVLEALTYFPCRDSEFVLDRLRSVVLFSPHKIDEIFRPMHATFPQFLIDPTRCTNKSYLVDVSRQHARLAHGCLKALLTLNPNPCELEDPSVFKAQVPDLEDRVDTHIPKHIQYACLHWAEHLKAACKPAEVHAGNGCSCKELFDLLDKFIAQPFLSWLETLGYMGRLDLAMTALEAAHAWVAESHEGIRTRLVEARQLVINHYAEIDVCPHDVHRATTPRDGPFGHDLNQPFPKPDVNIRLM